MLFNVASPSFDNLDVYAIQYGLKGPEKRKILLEIFEMISADGKLRKEEREYSSRFCKVLNISQAFFDAAWVDYFEKNPNKLIVE
jgi:hypothetical protein